MKRKLKKFEQILSENPGWTFKFGFFDHDSWKKSIISSMLKNFGREHEFSGELNNYLDGFYYDESWFEQPVKKKLYAYKVQLQRPAKLGNLDTIVFSEIPDEPYEQRVPWYDIEYGDDK